MSVVLMDGADGFGAVIRRETERLNALLPEVVTEATLSVVQVEVNGQPLGIVELVSPCMLLRCDRSMGIAEYADPMRLARWALSEHRKRCGCTNFATIEERYP